MGDTTASPSPAVVGGRLQPPQLPETVLRRQRLHSALDDGARRGLTFVTAPAGFGKTVAVAQWGADRRDQRTAWLSLGAGDDRPLQFWRHLVEAMSVVEPEALRATRSHLKRGKSTSGYGFTGRITNELCSTSESMTLVIDNLELLTDTDALEQLAALLESLPPNISTVLVSRSSLDLPLSRWRARGGLTELTDDDLRFTDDEAHSYLDLLISGETTPDQERIVVSKTRGWAAGLYLAALGLRRTSDQAAFLETLGSADDFVGEYLVTEVLAALPEEMRSFLMSTSLLDSMTPDMCAAITGHGDAHAMLIELQRLGLFVERATRQGYWQYHPLFREVLRSLLAQDASEERLAQVHLAAAGAYQARGRLVEAVEHALQARDYALAEDILEQHGLEMLRTAPDRTQTLLDSLAEGTGDCSARVSALRLWAAAVLGDVERLENVIHTGKEPHAAATGLTLAYLRGDLDELESLLPAAAPVTHEAAIAAARALVAAYRGDTSGAEALLLDALQRPQRNPYTKIVALSLLAWVHVCAGKLSAGTVYAGQAIKVADEKQMRWFHGVRWAELARAHAEFDRGDVDAAYRYIEPISESKAIDALAHMETQILFARIMSALGQRSGATQRLAAALVGPDGVLNATARDRASLTQAQLCLVDNDPELAQAWLPDWRRRIECGPTSDLERLVLARILIASGRCSEAEQLLGDRFSHRTASVRYLVEAQKLRATAAALRDDPSAAMQLEVALALAAPEGFAQTFVDDARAVASIRQRADSNLHRRSPKRPADTARSDAHAVVELATANGPLGEPLTDRELAVLRYLPTRLSNHEIADQLFVSINTVKSHMRAIYRKLDVNRRNDAVASAVSHGLL